MNRFSEGAFVGALVSSMFWMMVCILMAVTAGWIE